MQDNAEDFGKVLMGGESSPAWQTYQLMNEPQTNPQAFNWHSPYFPSEQPSVIQTGGPSDLIKKGLQAVGKAISQPKTLTHPEIMQQIERDFPTIMKGFRSGDADSAKRLGDVYQGIYMKNRGSIPSEPPKVGRPREQEFNFYNTPDYLSERGAAGSALDRNDIRRKWRKREYATPQEIEELKTVREPGSYQYHNNTDYQKELSAATTREDKNVVRNRWQMRELRSRVKE